MKPKIAIYLAGTIKKEHETNDTHWGTEELATLEKALNDYEITFLNPAFRKDNLSDQKSVFGRDMLQVYSSDVVFVDARDERSPLKVISFSTPDNTKPDFASGYPYLSKITNISAQVTAMPTKSCRLYWAVLPKGAAAPTAEDFKANAVTGNLGFGSTDVIKNTAYSFDVNNVPLEELESYDLYLWLTDVDNGQSSAVKKLSFTTVDGTPPVFNTQAEAEIAEARKADSKERLIPAE